MSLSLHSTAPLSTTTTTTTTTPPTSPSLRFPATSILLPPNTARTTTTQAPAHSRCLRVSAAGLDPRRNAVPNSNYVVPLDMNPTCITRPLAEILRDLNKRIPDNIVNHESKIIPWYHANRMLSFYAPGWCGEVRDVIFSEDGNVTVVYRVTVRGSDGEAFRESTGTARAGDQNAEDAVAAAEEFAFVRACSRFGLGLYLYHEE